MRSRSRYAHAVTRVGRLLRIVRRLALAVAFAVLMLAVSVAGAGIVAMWSHPPGTAPRAELTWHGDAMLRGVLDGSQLELVAIAAGTDRLAVLARGAIGGLTAEDQGPFNAALAEGTTLTSAIESDSAALRAELQALPGTAAADALSFGVDVVARRAAMLAALDATEGLRRSWATLTFGSLQASGLIALLADHDLAVAAAAAQGRAADYAAALESLGGAVASLDAAVIIRDRLANASDVSTLDSWVGRNRRYDEALQTLYGALRDSDGVITDAVRSAYREEGVAREQLPPDTRGLVIILADLGRGGLNQAVIAIDQARERLNLALQALESAAGTVSSGRSA